MCGPLPMKAAFARQRSGVSTWPAARFRVREILIDMAGWTVARRRGEPAAEETISPSIRAFEECRPRAGAVHSPGIAHLDRPHIAVARGLVASAGGLPLGTLVS